MPSSLLSCGNRPVAALIIANLLDVPEVFACAEKSPPYKIGGQRNVKKRKLEPEYASDIKTAAGSQVRSWNGGAGELWKRKRVPKRVGTGILYKRIDACEVRVIESVQRSKA